MLGGRTCNSIERELGIKRIRNTYTYQKSIRTQSLYLTGRINFKKFIIETVITETAQLGMTDWQSLLKNFPNTNYAKKDSGTFDHSEDGTLPFTMFPFTGFERLFRWRYLSFLSESNFY